MATMLSGKVNGRPIERGLKPVRSGLQIKRPAEDLDTRQKVKVPNIL